jgi:hypothetical protein
MPYRRGTVLGAFDVAAWDAYQQGGQGPPNGTLEDPNGGIIHFDAVGNNDYYTPPATPITDATVEKNPASTFYGWTEQEKNAYWAAQNPNQNPTGIVTDYLRQRATFAPGSNVATYSAADEAESDRQLRAFAAASPKIQAALAQLKTGAFRGAQQATFDAQQAAAVEQNAQQLLDGWLAYRNSFGGDASGLPLMPPPSYLGTAVSDDVMSALKALVAKLPPPVVSPGPPAQPTVTTVSSTTTAPVYALPQPSSQLPAATANYPAPLAPPAMPSDIAARTTAAGPVAVVPDVGATPAVPWWAWVLGAGAVVGLLGAGALVGDGAGVTKRKR